MMQTPWFETYIRLAFRIEKIFQTLHGRRFVSYYYGPSKWKAEEEAAPMHSPADLLRMVGALSVLTVTNRPGNLAFSSYLGGYRSQIEFNLDAPLDLSRVLEIMSHEGYPGHHVEAVLKEQELYQARGYVEHALDLLIAPQAVISEGLAMLASSMILSLDEEQAWLAEHIYPVAGVEPVAVDWGYVRGIFEWSMAVQGNAAFLLREGRPDHEVMQYLTRYLMVTEEQAGPMLVYLKIPFNTARIFSYTAGKRLLQPWLARSDQRLVFSRLLTEPLYPSELVEETPSP